MMFDCASVSSMRVSTRNVLKKIEDRGCWGPGGR